MNGKEIFEKMLEANSTYCSLDNTTFDVSRSLRSHLEENGQNPYAIVVTCSDSRVIPEMIFGAGLGELFVIREAGNVIGSQEIGSIEYAVAHLGVKCIVVLGHDGCGAVGAALSGHVSGYIAALTKEIMMAIGDETHPIEAVRRNVLAQIEKILLAALDFPPIDDPVFVVGAVYHQSSGEVERIVEHKII